LATGYVRQSAADIVSGEVVRAAPLNNEFNAIRDAMALVTGHSHDGTTGGGSNVATLADADGNNKVAVDTGNNRIGVFAEVGAAPVEQVRFGDGFFSPVTTNDVDLGSTSARFKDAWFAGSLVSNSITSANLTVTNLTVTNVLGTATFNNVVIGGTVDFTNAVLSNVATPTLSTDGATKGYVDDAITAVIGGLPVLGNLNMGGFRITNMGAPTATSDATTKDYVDFPVTIVSTTSVTAVSRNHYVLTNAAATTVTCPATLAGEFMITVANGRADNVIDRNGSNIMSLAENLTITALNVTLTVKAIDVTRGWRVY
jgi:hypothetical protein